jgi:hypothetical protein
VWLDFGRVGLDRGAAFGEERGIGVALSLAMNDDGPPGLPQLPEDAPVYEFTVQRGMAIVLVIETSFWYAGLLQAALARIALEGQN